MKRRNLLLGAVLLVGCRPTAEPSPQPSVESSSPAEAEFVAADVEVGSLSLASGVWSPFTDQKDKPRLAIDLVHGALRRAGIAVDTTLLAPTDLMSALEKGEYDGSEALWLTQERESYLRYSKPYLENRLVLLSRKGNKVNVESLSELAGFKLGVVRDYAYGPEVLENKDVELVFGTSDEGNLKALLEESVDYIIVDDLLVYYLFEYEREKAKELLVAGQEALVTRSLHLAINKNRPDAQEILLRFDEQIFRMQRDGAYNEALSVGWFVADVDGDGQVERVLSGKAAGTSEPEYEYELAGATATGAPRFLVDGEVYGSWQSIPERYKVEQEYGEDRFRPGVNLVLSEF